MTIRLRVRIAAILVLEVAKVVGFEATQKLPLPVIDRPGRRPVLMRLAIVCLRGAVFRIITDDDLVDAIHLCRDARQDLGLLLRHYQTGLLKGLAHLLLVRLRAELPQCRQYGLLSGKHLK